VDLEAEKKKGSTHDQLSRLTMADRDFNGWRNSGSCTSYSFDYLIES